MVKNILIFGDLGAATNLVKNLLLLSPDVDFHYKDRLTTILNQYPSTLNLSAWLETEYQLRNWVKHYGIDLSDNLNYNQYIQNIKKTTLPAVFINHSVFWQKDQLGLFADHMQWLYISPSTKLGLQWQIRSYCEKKTMPLLHDFTFENDRENQIKQYKNVHGVDGYYKINILSMMEIINNRQQEFKLLAEKQHLPLEWLLSGPVDPVVELLTSYFNIKLNADEVSRVISTWRALHWPLEETLNWRYFNDNNT